MSRNLTIVVIGLVLILMVVLGGVIVLVVRDLVLTDQPAVIAESTSPVATEQAEIHTATVIGDLPPPVIEALPTNTPLPTVAATVTPLPTNTPASTDTPEPTATNTPVPVVIVPTNPPPPPPPQATEPPPPPPPPSGVAGLTVTSFTLQDRSEFKPNGRIWYEFTIVNSTGGEVSYNSLGVLPRKDGGDRVDWYKHSYGGPKASIKPSGLNHEDNIKIPEKGGMTLRLVMCFDGFEACTNAGGNFVTLSPELPITIN
jgi:hypothetical protein